MTVQYGVTHTKCIFHMHNYAQAASLVSNLIVIISFLWECHMQCDTWLLHSTTILYFTDYSSSLCSSVIQSRDFAICFCAHNYISRCTYKYISFMCMWHLRLIFVICVCSENETESITLAIVFILS